MSNLFSLGQVVATPGALAVLEETNILPAQLLDRHVAGDWGDVDQHDWKENDLSVKQGFRILSSYGKQDDPNRLWIITEADRSSTTILLPEEY